MTRPRLLRTVRGVHATDYGQFTVAGGHVGTLDDLQLLARAEASPPSASDGATALVLIPHQNNFAMTVQVQLWSASPGPDYSDWEQVSTERLAVSADGTLRIGSPTSEETSFAMPPGDYWAEVSGRGFVNYGWPGSTEPGDEWRIRLWPATTAQDHIRKLWDMPGFGTPWGHANQDTDSATIAAADGDFPESRLSATELANLTKMAKLAPNPNHSRQDAAD